MQPACWVGPRGGPGGRGPQSRGPSPGSPTWPACRPGTYHLHTLHEGQPHGLVPREADHAGLRVRCGLQQRHDGLHAHLAALSREGAGGCRAGAAHPSRGHVTLRLWGHAGPAPTPRTRRPLTLSSQSCPPDTRTCGSKLLEQVAPERTSRDHHSQQPRTPGARGHHGPSPTAAGAGWRPSLGSSANAGPLRAGVRDSEAPDVRPGRLSRGPGPLCTVLPWRPHRGARSPVLTVERGDGCVARHRTPGCVSHPRGHGGAAARERPPRSPTPTPRPRARPHLPGCGQMPKGSLPSARGPARSHACRSPASGPPAARWERVGGDLGSAPTPRAPHPGSQGCRLSPLGSPHSQLGTHAHSERAWPFPVCAAVWARGALVWGRPRSPAGPLVPQSGCTGPRGSGPPGRHHGWAGSRPGTQGQDGRPRRGYREGRARGPRRRSQGNTPRSRFLS